MKKSLTAGKNIEESSQAVRLKRLRFRSWHRGWKETDLILGGFADAMLHTLSDSELASYEILLDEDDDVVWAWIIGKNEAPPEFSILIQKLEGFGRP